MRRAASAPSNFEQKKQQRLRLVTYSKHGALEADRHLAVLTSAMEREALVNNLITILCSARKNRHRGRDFLTGCFQHATQIVESLREKTAQLIEDVNFWQQAYVQPPPFKYEHHENYLTHIIVSLNFVDSFGDFRKFLNASCRRNPFAIPNDRPEGSDLKRWKRFMKSHQALLRLEAYYGIAEEPYREEVEKCIAATQPSKMQLEESAARDAAAAAAAALKKKRNADRRLIARMVVEEEKMRKQRIQNQERREEMRLESELRTKVRHEIFLEEIAKEEMRAAELVEKERKKHEEKRAQREQNQRRRRVRAKALAEQAARRSQERQIKEEALAMRQKSLQKAAMMARRKAQIIARERLEERREEMRRFAEKAQNDRLREARVKSKLNRMKAARTHKIMRKVEEREQQRSNAAKEARYAREQLKAKAILRDTQRVAKAAMRPLKKGSNESAMPHNRKVENNAAQNRISSYSKSIQILGKHKSALSAAERQLNAAKKRHSACVAAGDVLGAQKIELGFSTLQDKVFKQQSLVDEVESQLHEWGGSLKPILANNNMLRKEKGKVPNARKLSQNSSTVQDEATTGPVSSGKNSPISRVKKSKTGQKSQYRQGQKQHKIVKSRTLQTKKVVTKKNSQIKYRRKKQKQQSIGALLLDDDEDFEKTSGSNFKTNGAYGKSSPQREISQELSLNKMPVNNSAMISSNDLYSKAAEWEASYSTMLIAPLPRKAETKNGDPKFATSRSSENSKKARILDTKMKTKIHQANGTQADSKINLQLLSSNEAHSAGRRDLVRIGIEAAFKLPPLEAEHLMRNQASNRKAETSS